MVGAAMNANTAALGALGAGAAAPPATTTASNLFATVAPLLGVLLLVVLVGAVVIVLVRRFLRQETQGPADFSLEDLRQMHRRGEMSDAEFQRARAALIERARDSNKSERTKGGWEESGRRGEPADDE